MSKQARVTASPFEEDTDFPWTYREEGFISWVDEVFLEGYKSDDPMPSFEEAVEIVRGNGYGVEISHD